MEMTMQDKIDYTLKAIDTYKSMYAQNKKEIYFDKMISWEYILKELFNGETQRFDEEFDRIIFNRVKEV